MRKKSLKKWWYEKGCKLLYHILINLSGKNLGYIPLENLMEMSYEDMMLLYDDFKRDGLGLKVDEAYGEKTVFVFVE